MAFAIVGLSTFWEEIPQIIVQAWAFLLSEDWDWSALLAIFGSLVEALYTVASSGMLLLALEEHRDSEVVSGLASDWEALAASSINKDPFITNNGEGREEDLRPSINEDEEALTTNGEERKKDLSQDLGPAESC